MKANYLQLKLLSFVPQNKNACSLVRAKGHMGPERGKETLGNQEWWEVGEMRVKDSHRNTLCLKMP